MRFARYFLPWALVGVAACGKDEPPPQTMAEPQTVPDDLGRLVPPDAVLVFCFSPFARLEAKVAALVETVDKDKADEVDLNEVFVQSGVDPALVDRSRPLVVALALREGRPVPHFILPVSDPGKVGVAGAAVSGGYVAVALGGAAAVGEGTPALAQDLPAADVAVRVDVKRIVEQFRPMIEGFSAQTIVPFPPAQAENMAVLERMVQAVKDLVLTTERIEGGVNLDGGDVDLSIALTSSTGAGESKDAGPALGELASSISGSDYPMLFLVRAHWSDMMDFLTPMYDMLLQKAPEEQRTKFRAYLERSKTLHEVMGRSMAVAASFDAGGFEYVAALQPADPPAYLAKYRELIQLGSFPEMGLEILLEEPREIEGTRLDRYRMKFDWEKLMSFGGAGMPGEANVDAMLEPFFGKDGMRFAQGAVGDRVLVLMGRREGFHAAAIKTAKARSGTLPAAVRDALAENTSFLVYLDMRRVMGGVADLMRKVMPGMMAPVPAGDPVDLWMRASSGGRTCRFAMHVDVGGLAQVIKSMK